MAVSGVNDQNALKLAETGINNLHFTAMKSVGTQNLGMGIKSVVDDKIYLLNVSTVEIIEMMYFVGKDLGDDITFKVQDNTVIEIVLPE